MINAPDFDDNSDLFSALYKMVCGRARETGLPIEVILCQMIYQASYEIVLGGEISRQMITGIVEAAAVQVAINLQAEDAEGGDQ
ncbi:hypothetical protein IR012_03490 [Pseudomonas putida]|uniref:hypothetical protein n=1 Tax=Pseudomonas putida TaxID=303 RepID=UPI0018A99DD5|nr:hypothetical protein [Pseudomonas putida]MBF8667990.1 hypothetical protein [Pseudomonas putida]MBF8711377.1 hypothetical protein [Pseudomonas putida]